VEVSESNTQRLSKREINALEPEADLCS